MAILNPLKNIITFAAQLPEAKDLEGHLAKLPFKELASSEYQTAGFVQHPITKQMVSPFEDGFAFVVRYDEKVIPAAAVKAEVANRVAHIEAEEERPVSRKEKSAIKDQVMGEVVRTALARQQLIHAYYVPSSKRLFVVTASERMAQVVMNLLVKVVGSVKTETTHVTDVKHGLTTRLQAFLTTDTQPWEAFGDFEPGDACKLTRKLETKETINYTGLDIASCDELVDKLESGFKVESLRLNWEGLEMTLTQDFHLKSLKWEDSDDQDAEDEHEAWQEDAAMKVYLLDQVYGELLQLVEYKEEQAA
ncbi:recombination-associated protein RdgC [Oceanimonas pelagia]|uniref:Recombination-associated protein RdgC n=1 Tax=Oceanimonas pelagia TaxID=3028314 RepID=A0AA50QAZ3_9GAMM|nr:recombination-associated protein RdgC [Oceanimonas pelagia]WMC09566.1 recombination-associated protein RdgC [Oceanimonas pelagia]